MMCFVMDSPQPVPPVSGERLLSTRSKRRKLSVDPKRDTPDVLGAYAAKVRNDPRWTFLTGDWNTIRHLSIDGFKLATDDQLLHSAKFAIADKNGVVREYVSSLEDDAVDHVARTVDDLVRE